MLGLSESPFISDQATEQTLGSLQEMFFIREAAKSLLFGMVAELSTTIRPEQLAAALKRLQQEQPLLRAQVKKQPGQRPVLFLHPEIEAIPFETRSLSDATLNEILGGSLSAPFTDPGKPLLRAILVEGADHSTIVLVSHHLLLDGISLLNILAHLVKMVSGEGSHGSPRQLLPPSLETLLGLQVKPYEHVAREALLPFNPDIYTPEHVQRTRQFVVDSKSLSPDETSALRRRAKEEKTTVQGALAAAVLLTARRTLHEAADRPLSCLVPIDYRSHLGLDAGEPGVFFGAFMHIFPAGQVPAFWELARIHREGLVASSQDSAIRESTAGMMPMLRDEIGVDDLQDFVNRMSFDLMVSNLGVVPPTLFENCTILKDLWFYASASTLRTQTITALTWKDSLHIMNLSGIPVPNLLEEVHQELHKALQ